MYDECDNWIFGGVGYGYPARQRLVGFGYDPDNYISTAQIQPSPYTSQPLIQAKLGGLIKLIEACDDDQPPQGTIANGDAQVVYNSVIQNVTTEINGYLSSVYPIPLVQNNTVAILQVSGITTDGLGTVTSVTVIQGGNYLAAPAANQFPVYLRHIDPLCNVHWWGENWQQCQQGTGLNLTVAYAGTPFSDENGSTVQAQTITGTPTIVSGGTKYNCGDLIVLVGGQSFVPAKIREAALILICHSFYQRRIAPDEKNIFETLAKMWREKLTAIGIGDGMEELDGTYKRFYSAGQSWNQQSVLFGANSL